MVIIDLYSQRKAFAAFSESLSDDEKLAFLREHGELREIPTQSGFPQTFVFRSRAGIESTFFLRSNCLIFLGDHTTLAE